MPDFQRPIFLSGKVMLDSGTPPPESVLIERVCNGTPRPEGYTDSRGRFSFELGRNQQMLADASVGSSSDGLFGGGTSSPAGFGRNRPITERELMGCELRAVLPGYRSDVLSLAGRRVMDNPEVGTIVLHRMGNVEGTTISLTSLLAPKDAKKAFDKGMEAARKKKWEAARKEFEKAVEVYPKYATAWFELGRLRQREQNREEARNAYQKSLAADAKFVKPYLPLAEMASQERNWQETADITARMLRLDPVSFPEAHFLNSVANFNLRKLDAAETSARAALKIDTEHRFPRANHLLGIILANKADYAGAAEQMQHYLDWAPNAPDAETVKKQLLQIRKSSGQPAAAPAQP